jgi:hypothetical protein
VQGGPLGRVEQPGGDLGDERRHRGRGGAGDLDQTGGGEFGRALAEHRGRRRTAEETQGGHRRTGGPAQVGQRRRDRVRQAAALGVAVGGDRGVAARGRPPRERGDRQRHSAGAPDDVGDRGR